MGDSDHSNHEEDEDKEEEGDKVKIEKKPGALCGKMYCTDKHTRPKLPEGIAALPVGWKLREEYHVKFCSDEGNALHDHANYHVSDEPNMSDAFWFFVDGVYVAMHDTFARKRYRAYNRMIHELKTRAGSLPKSTALAKGQLKDLQNRIRAQLALLPVQFTPANTALALCMRGKLIVVSSLLGESVYIDIGARKW